MVDPERELSDLCARISDVAGLTNDVEWNSAHTLVRVIGYEEKEVPTVGDDFYVVVGWTAPEMMRAYLSVACKLLGA